MKNIKVFFVILAAAVGAVVIFNKNNTSSKQTVLSPQTNSEGSVIVKVTPKELTQSSPSWEFEIILDTHSGNLDQDLTKNSVLLDDKGNQFVSVAWEGDPPQGHHRQGLIKFKPISPKPSSIELKLYKIGNVDEKSFKWELK